MESLSTPDNINIERLQHRLVKVRDVAYEHLTEFVPEDIGEIWDAIYEELECLDCWDDKTDGVENGYSDVDLLQQLGSYVGTFIYEGTKTYEINIIEIFAVFAFSKAIAGLEAISGQLNFEKYSLAAECCIDAFDALQFGLIAKYEAEERGVQEKKSETFTERARKGGVGKKKSTYDEDGKYIVDEFTKLQESENDIIELDIPKQHNPDVKRNKKYKIRSNGNINPDACSLYIFHKCYTIPSNNGKATDFDRDIRYVKRVIYDHLGLQNQEADASQPSEDDTEFQRHYPNKYKISDS